jgi:hypothetical protein
LGKEVPTAPSVSPITVEEKPMRQPMPSSANVMRVASTMSQKSETARVSG